METNNSIVPGFDDDSDDTLKITLRRLPNIDNGCLIILSGFIDTYNSNFFQNQMTKVVSAGLTKIILECSQLTGIASTGFGALTNLVKSLNSLNGELVLASVQQTIYETIELLGFVQFFKISSTLEEAYGLLGTGGVGMEGFISSSVFPKLLACPACAKSLRAQRAGRFRCIGCKAIITITEDGQIKLG